MTKVKICGIRSVENALTVAHAGADLLGLNFYPGTPRYVTPAVAREIARRLREALGESCPSLVGVFVNASADEVRETVETVGLEFAQLSGDEPAETLHALRDIAFKAIRPADEAAALAEVEGLRFAFPQGEDAPSILLDAYSRELYGGTGETASEGIARAVKAAAPRLMLAGGLNPQNVAERVRRIRPWGVDVASGVEAGAPGLKDAGKVRAFIEAVRTAEA
ncbi:MAG: phosphoribosylanthranilate isomerase [Chloroflexi bacterium]|nr:phosphoribosylanthranilate isomerase [Chloroflexota bacterium]